MKKHDVRHCWCLGFSPWTFHPVFHGVKTTQHLGKIPGVPCNVCTVQFPGTATSRPALPGAGPMCLRCLAEFWITGKIREVLWNYFGIATEIPRCSKWFLVITTWEAISFGNYLESLGITMELVCFIPIYPPKKNKNKPKHIPIVGLLYYPCTVFSGMDYGSGFTTSLPMYFNIFQLFPGGWYSNIYVYMRVKQW